MTAAGIALRDYQLDALAAVEAAAAEGITRQLIQLPTGAGKTIVFAELLRRRGGRSLVLAHRDELINQAVEKIRLVWPDADLGIVKAEKNETTAQVIVASVQTLARERRLQQLPRDFHTVVIDEAHHAAAESYQAILRYVGVLADG